MSQSQKGQSLDLPIELCLSLTNLRALPMIHFTTDTAPFTPCRRTQFLIHRMNFFEQNLHLSFRDWELLLSGKCSGRSLHLPLVFGGPFALLIQ